MNLDDLTEEELATLAEQGSDEEKRAVARHPNASLDTLLFLAQEWFADDVDQNPLMLLHLEGGSDKAIKILGNIAHKTTRVDRLEELSRSALTTIRSIVAWNTSTQPSTLNHLAKDEDFDTRNGVANNEKTWQATLHLLAGDENYTVRSSVARNMNTSLETLRFLSKDEEAQVRINVAKNGSTSPDILALLAQDKVSSVRYGVAENTNTPTDSLELFAHDPSKAVKYIAEITLGKVKSMRKARSQRQRESNPVTDLDDDLTAENLEIIAQGNDEDARAVARHPNTSLDTLTWLASRGFAKEVAENPMILLYQEINDERIFVILTYIARHTDSLERLEFFACSQDPVLRSNVAQNKATPTSILERLLFDKDVSVVIYTLNVESWSSEMLDRVLESKHGGKSVLRRKVALHKNVSQGTLLLLSNDDDEHRGSSVRLAVAQNPKTSLDILRKLAQDEDSDVEECAKRRVLVHESFDDE